MATLGSFEIKDTYETTEVWKLIGQGFVSVSLRITLKPAIVHIS